MKQETCLVFTIEQVSSGVAQGDGLAPCLPDIPPQTGRIGPHAFAAVTAALRIGGACDRQILRGGGALQIGLLDRLSIAFV
jgi:hypothetical protein